VPAASFGPDVHVTGDPSVGIAAKILSPVLVVLIDAPASPRLLARIQRQQRCLAAEISDSFVQFDSGAGAA
jgi:hypothetical protein